MQVQKAHPPAPPQRSQPKLAQVLSWDTPDGWSEAPPAPMREINFTFGENGECYVAQSQGSLADNFNRWRKQMGQDPLPEEDIENLETVMVLGTPGYFGAIDGDYTSFGQTEAVKDYRMLGTIVPVPNTPASLFIKLIGPSAEVENQEDAFRQFCQSLRPAGT